MKLKNWKPLINNRNWVHYKWKYIIWYLAKTVITDLSEFIRKLVLYTGQLSYLQIIESIIASLKAERGLLLTTDRVQISRESQGNKVWCHMARCTQSHKGEHQQRSVPSSFLPTQHPRSQRLYCSWCRIIRHLFDYLPSSQDDLVSYLAHVCVEGVCACTHVCVHTQSCPIIWDPVDYSPPGSSVHGIFLARVQEWLPFPAPGDLPNPGIEPTSLGSPALAGGLFTAAPPNLPTLEFIILPGCIQLHFLWTLVHMCNTSCKLTRDMWSSSFQSLMYMRYTPRRLESSEVRQSVLFALISHPLFSDTKCL